MEDSIRPISIRNQKRLVIKRPISCTVKLTSESTPISPVSKSRNKEKAYSKSQPWKKEKKTVLDDEWCISMREKLLNNSDFSILENEDTSRILIHLNIFMSECAQKAEYVLAKRVHQLIEQIREFMKSKKTQNVTAKAPISIDENAIKSTIDKEYQDSITALDKDIQNKVETQRMQQEKELAEFETLWKEKMPSKYRKPSQKLLKLKQIERTLAISADFDQARSVHDEAQALAEIEQNEAQRSLMIDYKQAKKSLFEKHQKELSYINEYRRRKQSVLDSNYEKKIDEMNHRKLVIKQKMLESMSQPKQRSGTIQDAMNPPLSASLRSINMNIDTLLAPLIPPNDEVLLKQERSRITKKKKIQSEYQKKNANQILWKYQNEEETASISDPYKEITNPEPEKFTIQSPE